MVCTKYHTFWMMNFYLSIFYSSCPSTLAFPVSESNPIDEGQNKVVIEGKQDQANDDAEARRNAEIVWCRPDAMPNLREEGFCASADDLGDLCNFLEVSQSAKTCAASEGKYCCYRKYFSSMYFSKNIIQYLIININSF